MSKHARAPARLASWQGVARAPKRAAEAPSVVAPIAETLSGPPALGVSAVRHSRLDAGLWPGACLGGGRCAFDADSLGRHPFPERHLV